MAELREKEIPELEGEEMRQTVSLGHGAACPYPGRV
jgi:hypothetical protein